MWAAARVGRGWRQPQVSCRLLGLVCMGWDTFMSGQMALDISAKVMFAGMAYTDAAVMPLMMPFDGSHTRFSRHAVRLSIDKGCMLRRQSTCFQEQHFVGGQAPVWESGGSTLILLMPSGRQDSSCCHIIDSSCSQ